MTIGYLIPLLIATVVCLALGYFIIDALKPNRRSVPKAVVCITLLIVYIGIVVFSIVQTIS